jgi:hypothetical protein
LFRVSDMARFGIDRDDVAFKPKLDAGLGVLTVRTQRQPVLRRAATDGGAHHLLARHGGLRLALDDEMKKRDADGWCGVQIVNLASGDIVQWIRIEGAVTELYDVAVLPGVRRPMAASFTGPEINEPMTFEM